eukprot:14221850-Alexandrium_andersonii.AAC.1
MCDDARSKRAELQQDLIRAPSHSPSLTSLLLRMPGMMRRPECEGVGFMERSVAQFDVPRPPLACVAALGLAGHPSARADLASHQYRQIRLHVAILLLSI